MLQYVAVCGSVLHSAVCYTLVFFETPNIPPNMCCSVLQCVAVRCSAYQCNAVCYSFVFSNLQTCRRTSVAIRCSMLQCLVRRSVLQLRLFQNSKHATEYPLQRVAACCSVLQCVAACYRLVEPPTIPTNKCCSMLQCAAALQCAAMCYRFVFFRTSKMPTHTQS